MSNKKFITTKEGLNDLQKELETRMTETRKKVADDISHAREQGDLSENAAYTAALEAKQFNEARISELEDLIKNAEVKKVNKKDKFVGIGEKVKILRIQDKKEFNYTLVGENESDPSEGKISIKSPIGKALLNKKASDKVRIDLPSGSQEYEILSIN